MVSDRERRYSLLGIGLYSYAAAARYLRLPRATVRRWSEGEARVKGLETEELQAHRILSFLGLMELRAVQRLREEGLSLEGVRELAATVTAPHPLVHAQFHAGDERVEFEGDWPCRYWPLGQEGLVRIDPAVSFGKPIVGCGIPAYALASMVLKAGETPEAVAEWYDVPVAEVAAAVAWEIYCDDK